MECSFLGAIGSGFPGMVFLSFLTSELVVEKKNNVLYDGKKSKGTYGMEYRDKTVAESRVETVHIVRPGDLNDAGRLFGGQLMQWIDEVAALVAKRHSQGNVTTGSVDNLKFLHGVFPKDVVVIIGKVTYVGNSSMEVKVESFVERPDGSRALVNRAFLTLVGLGDDGRPKRLPRLILESEEDHEEWDRAEVRRQLRKQQNAEGFHFYG